MISVRDIKFQTWSDCHVYYDDTGRMYKVVRGWDVFVEVHDADNAKPHFLKIGPRVKSKRKTREIIARDSNRRRLIPCHQTHIERYFAEC